ncbi:MAG: O-antigen ligase family protein, partial [Chloroflexota bacterium]|nr:O-antigen ligase family protein [Chloroflexota bacterium]
MAAQAGRLYGVRVARSPTTSHSNPWLRLLAVALLAGVAMGAAVGAGLSTAYLVAGLALPFILLLTFARPHWGVSLYVVLVYADLLSILVQYDGLPPLARFAGAILLAAVLGYRLSIRRQGLVADPMTWWLLAYGGVVALGLFYARNPGFVTPNVVEFVRIFLAYLIIINAITTSERLYRTLMALLALAVALAALTIYQSLTGHYENIFGGLAQVNVSEISGGADGARPSGTLGDPNYYGQSLIFIIPLALYLASRGRTLFGRLGGLVATAMLIAAVIFTYSRGDALALGAVVVLALLYKRPKPIYIVGGALLLALALPLIPSNYLARLTTVVDLAQGNQQVILNEDSIRGRAGASQAAIAMFADHPFLGVGRENYPSYELEYLSGTPLAKYARGIPPHNLYLEIAAENGIVGLLVVGGLLLVAWRALVEA